MPRPLALALALLTPSLALAQATPEVPDAPPRMVIVPVPSQGPAAATPAAAPNSPAPLVVPLPRNQVEPAPTAAPMVEAHIPAGAPESTPAAPTDGAPGADPSLTPPPAAPVPPGAMLDGHLREGAFLSGPGSLTFVMHHTLMLASGGLATQIAGKGFSLELSSREAMLAGTLIGAGIGFGFSAWWQFNHWIGLPVANYGIINSAISGMFFTGIVNLMSTDPQVLTWTAVVGAELGAWLTATVGGGDMPVNKGLLMTSGAGWAFVYSALLLAIIRTSGTPTSGSGWVDTLLMAPGVGAGLMALATLKYNPTTAQILRADVFGAGVGGAVLLLSALVLGRFDIATPYVLSFITSAGAIAAVSLFWAEAAERPEQALYRDPERDRPYRNVWW